MKAEIKTELDRIIDKFSLYDGYLLWSALGIALYHAEKNLFNTDKIFEKSIRYVMYEITGDEKWLGKNIEK